MASDCALKTTTKRQYDVFCTEALRCMKAWGISDWRVEFTHSDIPGSRGHCETAWWTNCATIRFATKWLGTIDDAMIRRTARHEVIHLILDELNSLVVARYITNYQRELALERTVHRLEQLLP